VTERTERTERTEKTERTERTEKPERTKRTVLIPREHGERGTYSTGIASRGAGPSLRSG